MLDAAHAIVQQHGHVRRGHGDDGVGSVGFGASVGSEEAESSAAGAGALRMAAAAAAPWERPLGQARPKGSLLRPLNSGVGVGAALSLDATSALTAGRLTFAGPPSALLRDRRRAAEPSAALSAHAHAQAAPRTLT